MTLRKLSLWAVAAALVLPAAAGQRSENEMIGAARQVLGQERRIPSVEKHTAQPQTLTTLSRMRQMSVVGSNAGGFALVSHDESLPAVIGYAEGSFAEAKANANFQGYISALDAYLQHCADTHTAPQFIGASATYNPSGVKELMKCRWDQGEPYNLMCPTLYQNGEDRRSASGCVATALAQILYTLNQKTGYPTRARGQKRYFYLDGTYHMAYVTANLSALPMDWANLRATYSSSSPYKSQMAVARLMYACGVASEMYYAPGNSGTYTSSCTEGVNAFFEGIHSDFSGYDLGAYEQRIYDELDAGHPILISGNNGQGNHAFVADGYDSQGRLHLNMGWSGGGNGYYTIANMNGFSQAQTANFFAPDPNDQVRLSDDAPLEELRGLYAAADIFHPVTKLEEGTWYVLYNAGRYSAAHSSGLGKTVQNSRFVIGGEPTEVGAPQLVRFIAKDKKAGTYYIQTGTGDYFGALTNGGNAGSTAQPTAAYTVGQMFPDKALQYFWLKQDGTVMDCNEPGSQGIAGWGTATPADSLGHACWMILPTRLSTEQGDWNTQTELFNPEHYYTMSLWEDGKAFPMQVKVSSALSATGDPTQLQILPHADGWQMSVAEGTGIVSAKSTGFKTGNGSATSDTPLTLYIEPTSLPVTTGDADFRATSRICRVRCEAGYLGCDKAANLATVFCNKTSHADHTLWLINDRTAYLLRVDPEGIAAAPATPDKGNPQTFDLQGRPLATPSSLHIVGGKKVLR